jgi:hypothetical protein
MVFPAKSEKYFLLEMENQMNSNRTDRREITDNPKKIYVSLQLKSLSVLLQIGIWIITIGS